MDKKLLKTLPYKGYELQIYKKGGVQIFSQLDNFFGKDGIPRGSVTMIGKKSYTPNHMEFYITEHNVLKDNGVSVHFTIHEKRGGYRVVIRTDGVANMDTEDINKLNEELAVAVNAKEYFQKAINEYCLVNY